MSSRAVTVAGAVSIAFVVEGLLGAGGLSTAGTPAMTVVRLPYHVTSAPSTAQDPTGGGADGGTVQVHPASACYLGLNCGCVRNAGCGGGHHRRRVAPPPPPTEP